MKNEAGAFMNKDKSDMMQAIMVYDQIFHIATILRS